MAFFDLISLFGVAAFFAWLGYAPLQGQRVQGVKAKENLYKITDYFFVSFLFFSIAAVSDYILHRPTIASDFMFSFLVLLIVGTTFLFGFLTLVIPMLYLRTIGRGGKDFGDINPPPFGHTVFVTFLAAVSTVIWLALFAGAHTTFDKVLWPLSGLLCYIGAVRGIRYWDSTGWKSLMDALLLLLPFILFLLVLFLGRSFP